MSLRTHIHIDYRTAQGILQDLMMLRNRLNPGITKEKIEKDIETLNNAIDDFQEEGKDHGKALTPYSPSRTKKIINVGDENLFPTHPDPDYDDSPFANDDLGSYNDFGDS